MKNFLMPMLAVCGKEMLDGFRDRHSTFSIFIAPLLAPLAIVWLASTISDRQLDASIEFPVIGAQHAPELIDWIEAQEGVKVVKGPADPQAAVKNGDIDFALILPEDFAARLAAERTAEVQLVLDPARIQALPTLGRVRAIIHSFEETVVARRLTERSVDPEIVAPLAIAEIGVSNVQGNAGILVTLLPILLMLAPFMCGMHVAADAIAGERERKSLEPLLTLAVPRASIIIGKWLSIAALALAGVCFTVLGFVAASHYARASFAHSLHLGVLAAMLPVAFLAPGIQLLLSVVARSFKEAETYILYLWILPMLPFVGAMLSGAPDKATWMMAIPFFSQHALISNALAQGNVDWSDYAISATTTAAACAIVVSLTAHLLKGEKSVFGFR